jgi:hypothetical protein
MRYKRIRAILVAAALAAAGLACDAPPADLGCARLAGVHALAYPGDPLGPWAGVRLGGTCDPDTVRTVRWEGEGVAEAEVAGAAPCAVALAGAAAGGGGLVALLADGHVEDVVEVEGALDYYAAAGPTWEAYLPGRPGCEPPEGP